MAASSSVVKASSNWMTGGAVGRVIGAGDPGRRVSSRCTRSRSSLISCMMIMICFPRVPSSGKRSSATPYASRACATFTIAALSTAFCSAGAFSVRAFW